MLFHEALAAFVEAFKHSGTDYALTGDLALHVCGYPRARPRLEFVAAPSARDVASTLGFRLIRASERVAIYARDEIRVAIIFSDVRGALPGLIDGRVVLVLDPARRLALAEEMSRCSKKQQPI